MKKLFVLVLGVILSASALNAQADSPGDLGTPECLLVQQNAQAAVIDGEPYRNHGQLVRTVAHVAGAAEDSGEISEECATCIISQFARRLPIEEQEPCGYQVDEAIVLVVDPLLEYDIRDSLDQFEVDLFDFGYTVIEQLSDFLSPSDLRTYLAELYTATNEKLVGAILIGDIFYAYQWVTLSSTAQETISFQYYSDLDGIFDASPDYISPGGHEYSFDIHSGEFDWEIWVGVLPMYKGDFALTAEAINRYFEKNHAFRTGGSAIPRAYLEINEHHSATTLEEHNQILQGMSTGQYAWTPFSSAPNAYFFFDSLAVGLSVAQGYESLSAGIADFTVGSAHGYWGAHGQIDILWVESNPVNTVFFWSNGCAVGNLDYPDNFLTSILYSPTSTVLIARGTTNNSGGMGNNENGFFGHNIATALSEGANFGDAILYHVNVPLVFPWNESREFHFATCVILGDPTLLLP